MDGLFLTSRRAKGYEKSHDCISYRFIPGTIQIRIKSRFPRPRTCIDEFCSLTLIRDSFENKILLNALQAHVATPSRSTHTVYFNSNSFDVYINSGASSTCTMHRQDFIPGTFHSLSGYTINGISSALEVIGYGTIRWVIHDNNNVPIDVEIERSLLIKDLPMKLPYWWWEIYLDFWRLRPHDPVSRRQQTPDILFFPRMHEFHGIQFNSHCRWISAG